MLGLVSVFEDALASQLFLTMFRRVDCYYSFLWQLTNYLNIFLLAFNLPTASISLRMFFSVGLLASTITAGRGSLSSATFLRFKYLLDTSCVLLKSGLNVQPSISLAS